MPVHNFTRLGLAKVTTKILARSVQTRPAVSGSLPANCTTAKMLEALVGGGGEATRSSWQSQAKDSQDDLLDDGHEVILKSFTQDGAFCLVHNNYGPDSSLTVGNITVAEWRNRLEKVLPTNSNTPYNTLAHLKIL